MRLSQTEKFEIIRLVEQSNTSVNKTLKELGINKPTFYLWYNAYLQDGYDGLAPKPVTKKQYWNQIPESEKQRITELALDHPQKATREIACLYIKDYKKYVSESSVYRILKAHILLFYKPVAYGYNHYRNQFYLQVYLYLFRYILDCNIIAFGIKSSSDTL